MRVYFIFFPLCITDPMICMSDRTMIECMGSASMTLLDHFWGSLTCLFFYLVKEI